MVIVTCDAHIAFIAVRCALRSQNLTWLTVPEEEAVVNSTLYFNCCSLYLRNYSSSSGLMISNCAEAIPGLVNASVMYVDSRVNTDARDAS